MLAGTAACLNYETDLLTDSAVDQGVTPPSSQQNSSRQCFCYIIFESVCDEIKENSVIIRTKKGVEEIPCDAIIMAMGYTRNVPYEGMLEELGDKLVVVGDANGTSNAMDAGFQGFEAGYFA